MVILSAPVRPTCTRTLKVNELNGIQPSYIYCNYLPLCCSCCHMSKHFLEKQKQGRHNHSPTEENKWHAITLIWTNIHVHISPADSDHRFRVQANDRNSSPGPSRRSVSRTVEWGWKKKNGGFSTQGVQQNMKSKVSKQVAAWEMTAVCTFSLQLSSTSDLIRLSHPSVNHAGSLHRPRTQTHTNGHKHSEIIQQKYAQNTTIMPYRD